MSFCATLACLGVTWSNPFFSSLCKVNRAQDDEEEERRGEEKVAAPDLKCFHCWCFRNRHRSFQLEPNPACDSRPPPHAAASRSRRAAKLPANGCTTQPPVRSRILGTATTTSHIRWKRTVRQVSHRTIALAWSSSPRQPTQSSSLCGRLASSPFPALHTPASSAIVCAFLHPKYVP